LDAFLACADDRPGNCAYDRAYHGRTDRGAHYGPRYCTTQRTPRRSVNTRSILFFSVATHFSSPYFFRLLLLPALLSAIATACFWGLPAFISVLIFVLIVFFEEPFFSGMTSSSPGANWLWVHCRRSLQ